MLNKVGIFVLFLNKNYSRRFITLRLNHWWQMKYPGDAFHTFLDLDNVIYLAVNGTVTSLLVLIQNILNCVLKTNEAFMGLKRHGGQLKKFQNYNFRVEYPFNFSMLPCCSWLAFSVLLFWILSQPAIGQENKLPCHKVMTLFESMLLSWVGRDTQTNRAMFWWHSSVYTFQGNPPTTGLLVIVSPY